VIEKLRGQGVHVTSKAPDALFWGVIVVGLLGLAWSIWQSKRETPEHEVTAPDAAKPAAPVAASSAGRFTVQLGAFSSRANAEALLAKARPAASDGRIVATSAGGKSVFRVVAGSFATQTEANAHAATLKKSGYPGFVKQLD